MGFLRVPNLAPWLILNVNILGVRAELSLISFAGSDSILHLGREGIKEREEGKRGGGGRLFEGGDYSRDGYYSRKCGTYCLRSRHLVF